MTLRSRRLIAMSAGVVVLLVACGSAADTVGTAHTGGPDGTTAPTTTVEPSPVSTTSSPPTVAGPVDADEQAALDAARATWDAAALVDYRYVLHRNCECPVEWVSPHIVIVHDGEVVAERLAWLDQDPPGPALTIEDVFSAIEDGIRRGSENHVTYHADTGAPKDVQIDLPAIAADGGFDLRVELTPLTAEQAAAAAEGR